MVRKQTQNEPLQQEENTPIVFPWVSLWREASLRHGIAEDELCALCATAVWGHWLPRAPIWWCCGCAAVLLKGVHDWAARAAPALLGPVRALPACWDAQGFLDAGRRSCNTLWLFLGADSLREWSLMVLAACQGNARGLHRETAHLEWNSKGKEWARFQPKAVVSF